jgi:predicted acetyltransferase
MPATPHEVRTLAGADQIAEAQSVFATSLIGLSFPATDDVLALHEPGRGLGVFDGERIVGVAESFASWLTVPGGARVAHAAVTDVGVLPTHTRRGIVTALMNHQLQDIAARGEVVASLRASEAVIYERFGYGVATRAVRFEVARRRAQLRPTVATGSPVQMVDPGASEELRRRICEQATWPGSIGRPDVWWHGRRLWAAAQPGLRYLAISGIAGQEDGYALYHPVDSSTWFAGGDLVVAVDDFVATSPAAYLGLIRHFATLDLIDTVRLRRPVDDPLAALFTDSRAVKLTGDGDETWLRLVDVAAALAARSYQDSADMVIGVSDRQFTANEGRYRVGPGGVSRTDAAPELSLDVSALAAVYLGGVSWRTIALAGRVSEHRPGAIEAADALFAVSTAPFAGTGF